eukprot:403376956
MRLMMIISHPDFQHQIPMQETYEYYEESNTIQSDQSPKEYPHTQFPSNHIQDGIINNFQPSSPHQLDEHQFQNMQQQQFSFQQQQYQNDHSRKNSLTMSYNNQINSNVIQTYMSSGGQSAAQEQNYDFLISPNYVLSDDVNEDGTAQTQRENNNQEYQQEMTLESQNTNQFYETQNVNHL